MKVYLLTQGSYSDYSVAGIFTDLEKLEEYKRIMRGTYNDEIETYELDEYPNVSVADFYKRMLDNGYDCYVVEMSKDGTANCNPHWTRFQYKSHAYLYKLYENNKPFMTLRVELWAKSAEHAIKIANEKRSMLLANDMWKDIRFNEVLDF